VPRKGDGLGPGETRNSREYLTPSESVTRQFYIWERRGRGWQVWNYPVELEPPFQPFIFHHAAPAGPPVDDGRRPTLLSSLVDRIQRRSSSAAIVLPPGPDPLLEEVQPAVFDDDSQLVEVQISVPPELKITSTAVEHFLLSLTYSAHPVGFEVVGLPEAITIQVACREPDLAQLRQQLRAHFPEAVLNEKEGILAELWDEPNETVIVDFGLSHEFMRPLKVFDRFENDPLIGITGALAELEEGEVAVLQIVFQAARNPWGESILRAVTDWDGKSFFVDAPDMVSLAKDKVRRPLYTAVIRVAAQAGTRQRAWEIAKGIGGALTQYSDPASNELIPLQNDGYSEYEHVMDLIYRTTHRSGMLLNSEELLSFVHLPSASVRIPKLKREVRKTKAAPSVAIGHGLILGENLHAGKTISISLDPEQRIRHAYVIGASGTGKSTLLLNLIIQDIRNGEGIAVLDPHGDLIDQILGYVPDERFGDVVLLDPSDEDYPIGFNIVSARSELEKTVLSSDLVAVFRRLSTSWGDQMTSVLGNAFLALLESADGGTLVDLRRFLVEKEFRRRFLETVKDSEVVYYWREEFPLLAGRPQAPILTRLDTFLRTKIIRNMVAQKENRLDFRKMMDEGKIFLAKLAQGAIGEENAYLLGTFLVSKIHQTAMSRQGVSESERRNFYLYIDEFQNFVTPSMAAVLSGARKFRLGLVLAHQELRQLSNREPEVASAVLANAATRVVFRVGDDDARKLEDGFTYFDAKDLQNLGIGEAICRIERAEFDFNLKTLPLPNVDPETATNRREKITTLSRERYGTRRAVVEAALAAAQSQPKPATGEKAPPRPSREKKAEITRMEPPVAQPSPGRGGPQHKYLQDLIKRWAEGKGYRTTIEKQILDGLGSVDVALEKEGCSIACEISISTTVEHETDNIQKCLAAGFTHVALVSSDKKVLNKASKSVSAALNQAQIKQVRFLTPEELFAFIESLAVKPSSGKETGGDTREVLTARELEDLLKIDVKTVYSYVQKGLLPYVRIQSNVRFLRSEIIQWMEERRFRPKPPGGRT